MNNNHVQEQLLAYLTGELDAKEQHAIREHLGSCEFCRKEMETVNTFWSSLHRIPQEQPSDAMRERFYDMLNETIEQTEQPAPVRKQRGRQASLFEKFFFKPAPAQFAFALLLLAIGGFAGYRLSVQPAQEAQKEVQIDNTEISQLHQEVMTMNRLLAMSLLQQQSASERLKGVSLSSRVEGSDPEIREALLQALKYDPNVNVRLAALDALTNDSAYQIIKTELLESLPKQSSPLVQLEIINWIVEQREKNATDALRKMLNSPSVNKAVKQRITRGLQELNS